MSVPAASRLKYLALLHLVVALANTRTPKAKKAQLASGNDDALLAGCDPAAVAAALADVETLADAKQRQDPHGLDASRSSPEARARRQASAVAAREETEAALVLAAPPSDEPLSEHEARKAQFAANRKAMETLAGGRT